jgi:ATP-binding cassette subfamily B protein
VTRERPPRPAPAPSGSSWALGRLPGLLRESLGLCWSAGRGTLISALLCQLVGGIAVAVQLFALRQVLAGFVTGRGPGALAAIAPMLALLVGAWAVTGFAGTVLGEHQRLLGQLIRHEAEGLVVDVACAVDLATFESAEFHDRLVRARAGAADGPYQMVIGLLGFLNAMASVAGIGVALFALQPILLALLALACLPLLLAGTRNSRSFYLFAWQGTPRERRRWYLVSLLTGAAGAKEVRAFGAARHLRDRYDRLSAERLRELRSMIAGRLRLSLLASLGTAVITGATVLLLGYLTVTGRTDLAAAGAGAAGVLLLGQRLQGLAYSITSLYESALFVEDYSSFTALRSPVGSVDGSPGSALDLRSLGAERVTFTYPGAARPALDGVSLTIERDQVVALVGENGSGKTTLAKVLCGLYVPDGGRVLWDGADLASLYPVAVRASIAVVFQDFVRYLFTVRENIGMGRPEGPRDDRSITRAAELAGADGFLPDLPRGYDTQLGVELNGGVDLSTGQWQRLSLARAFFRDAPFLVLDEPTSAIDARAEHELFDRMRALAKGRAVLLISHRFSTVRSADRVYVLAGGRVVEYGTHDELMDRNGHYAELYRLQSTVHLGAARPPMG